MLCQTDIDWICADELKSALSEMKYQPRSDIRYALSVAPGLRRSIGCTGRTFYAYARGGHKMPLHGGATVWGSLLARRSLASGHPCSGPGPG